MTLPLTGRIWSVIMGEGRRGEGDEGEVEVGEGAGDDEQGTLGRLAAAHRLAWRAKSRRWCRRAAAGSCGGGGRR